MRRLFHWTVTGIIKLILSILCRVDSAELAKLPLKGPFLVIVNHVNFLEVPIIYAWLQPRTVHSLVKEETWHNPLLAVLANTWHAIPIKRGVADFQALDAANEVLASGGILIMAPEGTRSKNGILRRAHGGAAYLAWKNKVPVYPVAHTGGESFFRNLRRFRRTDFRFRVGEPFTIHTEPQPNGEDKLDSTGRARLTETMMVRLARLLPEDKRGHYRDAAAAESAPDSLYDIPSTEVRT